MTPEQIAREAAESLVYVVRSADGRHLLMIGTHLDFDFGHPGVAADCVAEIRGHVTRAALAAIERDRRQCLLPGAMSEGDLAGVEGAMGGLRDHVEQRLVLTPEQGETLLGDMEDLLAEVYRLRRAFDMIATSGPEGESYLRGYDAGREAIAAKLDRCRLTLHEIHEEAAGHAGQHAVRLALIRRLAGQALSGGS